MVLKEMLVTTETMAHLNQKYAIFSASCLVVVRVILRRGVLELWQAVSGEMTIASW
jgi:hypothetical protein